MRLSLLFFIVALLSLNAFAQPAFKVLYAFGSGSDGGGLWGSVVFDPQGNVYGVTFGGGPNGGGTLFELSPQNGQWTLTTLHSFPSSAGDGVAPYGGPVVDGIGNVYGTTSDGGIYGFHWGTVYEATPGPDGWNETIIHSFGGPGDVAEGNWTGLTIDESGNLYGGSYAAFELSPSGNGWDETILHSFDGQNGDGWAAKGAPIWDAQGNLYGSTWYGGGEPTCPANKGCGTVYQLQPGFPNWKEHVIHRFGSFPSDGTVPGLGPLTIDSQGNLYGVTSQGGANLCVDVGCGTIFKLTPVAASTGTVWIQTILYNFVNGSSGNGPGGNVIIDGAGNLYGTTGYGGSRQCGCGVVYELSPKDGGWKYTVLHTFIGPDGDFPDANLTFGPDGNLYGTTAQGGTYGAGVVFEIEIAQ